MNRWRLFLLFIVLALLSLAPAAGSAPAAPTLYAPTIMPYQGHVLVDGKPYGANGSQSGYFKFAIVDSGGAIQWSNAALSAGEPDLPVKLSVTNGLFSVLLGDTGLDGMKNALASSYFADPETYLRVWFSTTDAGPYTLLADKPIASVPYAFRAQEAQRADEAANADFLDGQHAGNFQRHYANVVVVAKNGTGDYATITEALAHISYPNSDNRYLVWVAPGVYNERVTMRAYVDVEGAGESETRITQAGGADENTGTVLGATGSELRHLTVENTGGAAWAVAISNNGQASSLLHLTARASGGSEYTYGVRNINTSVEMQDVRATASCGGNTAVWCVGVDNEIAGPAMTDVWARGDAGGNTAGIRIAGRLLNGGPLLMTRVTAVATNGVNDVALDISDGFPLMIRNLVAEASRGGAGDTGVKISQTTVTIQNSTIESGSTGISAWTNIQPVTVEVSNSQVSGPSNTISVCNGGGTWAVVMRVGATHLNGGPATRGICGGSLTCAGVYDEDYAFYPSTCP